MSGGLGVLKRPVDCLRPLGTLDHPGRVQQRVAQGAGRYTGFQSGDYFFFFIIYYYYFIIIIIIIFTTRLPWSAGPSEGGCKIAKIRVEKDVKGLQVGGT